MAAPEFLPVKTVLRRRISPRRRAVAHAVAPIELPTAKSVLRSARGRAIRQSRVPAVNLLSTVEARAESRFSTPHERLLSAKLLIGSAAETLPTGQCRSPVHLATLR